MKNSIRITDLTDHQKAVLFDIAVERRVIKQADVESYASLIKQRANDARIVLERLGPVVSSSATGSNGSGPALVTSAPATLPPTSDLSSAARQSRRKARSAKGAATKAAKRPATPARPTITAEQLESRRLQGQYLSAVRQFPKAERAEWSEIAKSKGRKVAVANMRRALKLRLADQVAGI